MSKINILFFGNYEQELVLLKFVPIMKKLISSLLCLLLCNFLTANTTPNWGKTGHRTIGAIAKKHLKKSTQKKIQKILDGESLAYVSIHSDEIKSDSKYKAYHSWHYVNFAPGKKYGEDPINPKGDLVQGIKVCIDTIRNTRTSKADKAFHIKLLTHLVGDLHQPLHVGHGHDKGGNDIKLEWFGEPTNIHRVWDTNMLESYKMSYSELAANTKVKTESEINAIKNGTLLDWVHESQALAETVYASAEAEENLRYKYSYKFFPVVEDQMLKGGIRLAYLLEAIFSKSPEKVTTFLKGIPELK